MKTVAYALIIVLLGIIAFFQFKKYQRFHPPVNYEYVESDDIDKHYHDPSIVENYLSKATEVGSFAREMWCNHKVDVRFPNEKRKMSAWGAERYNNLIVEVKQLEGLLKASKLLKKQGYSNEEIKAIEAQGVDPNTYTKDLAAKEEANFLFEYLSGKDLRRGNVGQEVMELQKLLKAQGHETMIDGNFRTETESTLKAFQESKELYSSGVLDPVTLRHLVYN